MRLYTGAGGREKASMALKERKSNEEPSSGGRGPWDHGLLRESGFDPA